MRCRLCGGPAEEITDYDLARVQPHWRRFDHPTRVVIARCLDHGSLFTVLPPPPAILLTQYQYDHAAYCGSATGGSTGRTTRCLEGLRRWLPPGTRILDLGGGDGAFAIQAARAGYESWMLETGAPPLGLLEREGVRFVRELGALAPGTFDAVTLWNVLEHAWPVEGLLAPIRKVLRPGGMLLGEVPTITRFARLCLLGRFLPDGQGRAQALRLVTNYTHLQLLAASEARAVLSGHGFEVLELQPQQGVDYEGATYVRVYVPWEPLARLLGGLAGTRPVKNLVAGRNKLFFAARLPG